VDLEGQVQLTWFRVSGYIEDEGLESSIRLYRRCGGEAAECWLVPEDATIKYGKSATTLIRS
jgi:hypothetical protein